MYPNVERYELKGLCMTCNHAGFCADLARSQTPVWRCEEFDDREPTALRESALRSEAPREPRGPAWSGVAASGLCSNCANLSMCRFPREEVDVLHCEEYA